MVAYWESMMQLTLQFHHAQYSNEQINKSLSEILASNTLLSMATLKDNRDPWINTVYYAYNEKLDFYLMTPTDTQHCTNLKTSSSVAVSISDSHQQPTDKKRGLQLFGTWELTTGPELEEGTKLYGTCFPWLSNYIKNVKDWETTTLQSRIYVIHTRTIKIFDEVLFGPENWVIITLT